MAKISRDRPSRFILEILQSGERLTSRQIYDLLTQKVGDRFSIQQVYRSVNTMTRSGRIQRDGHEYFLEGVAAAKTQEDAIDDPLAVEPTVSNAGLELALARVRKWFFNHPDEEFHESILLHKLELEEKKLTESLVHLVKEGTLTSSTESDFLGTAYKLAEGAEMVAADIPSLARARKLDTLELKARFDDIKQTLFSISKELGKLDKLVTTEIEGE